MTYTYYGPESEKGRPLSHSTIKNNAIREAVRVTGVGGWELELIDHYHAEVQNEDSRKWESESKVVLRRAA